MDITRLTVLLGFSTCKISFKIRKMSDIHVVDVCRLDHKLNFMFRDVKKLILTLQIVFSLGHTVPHFALQTLAYQHFTLCLKTHIQRAHTYK